MITRRLAAVALAAAAVLGLAACSGGSDTASSGTGGTASALRLGYLPILTHAPAIVGIGDGLFQKSLGSTKLTSNVFAAGPAATEALLSGSIDAAFMGPGPTVNAYVQSKDVTVIAGAASDGASLVVRAGITSAAQLKGKKLATPQLGNTQDIALRYWLHGQGLKTTSTGGGDVSILPQSSSDAVSAFKQGQIDGAWLPEPYATELTQAGGSVLVDEKDLWPDHKFVTTDLVVKTDYLKRYPDTVKALLRGLLAAETQIAKHPSAAQATTSAGIAKITGTPIPAAVLSSAWKQISFGVDPDASSLLVGAQHAQDVGLLTGNLSGLIGVFDLRPLNALLKADGEPTVASP